MKKKRAIALCAIDLLAKNGLVKTSVESIAQAAGVAKGTVYLYFNTKEEIILEIWNYVLELMDEHHQQMFHKTTKAHEKLQSYFDFSIFDDDQQTDQLLKLFAMNLSIVLAASHEGLVAHFKRVSDKEIVELQYIIAEGIKSGEFKQVDTKMVARLFANSFKGTLVDAICKGKDVHQVRQELHPQRDFLLEAIKAP